MAKPYRQETGPHHIKTLIGEMPPKLEASCDTDVKDDELLSEEEQNMKKGEGYSIRNSPQVNYEQMKKLSRKHRVRGDKMNFKLCNKLKFGKEDKGRLFKEFSLQNSIEIVSGGLLGVKTGHNASQASESSILTGISPRCAALKNQNKQSKRLSSTQHASNQAIRKP